MLLSRVQPSDSVVHIYVHMFFFRFFSIVGCNKTLSTVPSAILCPLCLLLVSFVEQSVMFNPKLLVCPSLLLAPLLTTSLFSMFVSLFLFCK